MGTHKIQRVCVPFLLCPQSWHNREKKTNIARPPRAPRSLTLFEWLVRTWMWWICGDALSNVQWPFRSFWNQTQASPTSNKRKIRHKPAWLVCVWQVYGWWFKAELFVFSLETGALLAHSNRFEPISNEYKHTHTADYTTLCSSGIRVHLLKIQNECIDHENTLPIAKSFWGAHTECKQIQPEFYRLRLATALCKNVNARALLVCSISKSKMK